MQNAYLRFVPVQIHHFEVTETHQHDEAGLLGSFEPGECAYL